MTQRVLHLAKDLTLPLDAVTQTFAIFGKRGSGKTNGATVLVEELVRAHLPVVVLDPVDAWWGLKSSFDGKKAGLPIYIFGGEHKDLPLESTAGELMADLVAKEHLPCILSMKMWGVAERARFVTDFAKRLLQVNVDPVMMVLEEADAFIPQRPAKGEEAMLGAMDRLVRWGRQSGVGCTIVTQRSAKVNKDITTQAETLIAFRTTGPQDRDAINEWIKFHAGDDKRDEVMSTLPTLPSGTGWVWSPEWLELFDRVAFRRRETFDSAATPKVGEKRPRPKQLADVDLDRLRTQMSATIEKAKADDPRELRKQIADLKKEVGVLQASRNSTEPNKSEGSILTVADRKLLTTLGETWKETTADLANRADEVLTSIHARAQAAVDAVVSAWRVDVARAREEFTKRLEMTSVQKVLGKIAAVAPEPFAGRREERTSRVTPAATPQRRAELGSRVRQSSDSDNAGDLTKGERTVLTAIAQREPNGVSRTTLTALTGYKRSTRDLYLQQLARRGYTTDLNNGLIGATAEGLAALGSFEELPTGHELAEYWRSKLPEGERRVLEALLHHKGAPVDRDELSNLTGYKRSTRDLYIQQLARRQIIVVGRDGVRAAEELLP